MKRIIVQALDRPGLRHVLGAVVTAYITLRERHLVRVYPEDGAWLYRVKDFCFALDRIELPDKETSAYLRAARKDASALLPRLSDTPLQSGSTVLDIGAGIGRMTYLWSKILGPEGKVLSVEAHPKTFACLEKNCRYNKLTNVVLENYAIADARGDATIDRGENYEAANVFTGTGVKVKATTVDDLTNRHGIERIDLLYMNIEGAERLAITVMTDRIAKTRFALIGCHDFRANKEGLETMRTKAAVVEFLLRSGFGAVTARSQSQSAYDDFVLGWNLSLENDLPAGFERQWPFCTFFEGKDLSFQ
jgi:FkbM family methyltransferase